MIASAAGHVTGGPLLLALPIAAAAGLVSFASPCVLPLVPGYLSFMTGLSGAELAGAAGTKSSLPWRRILLASCLFVLGFSFVFVSLGAAFGGLGDVLREHQTTLNRVFGGVTIVLGLAFCGVFQRLPFASRELKLHRTPRAGLVGAPVLGAMFGLGWTPCIGPTLSAVLGLAASSDGASAQRGAVLSVAYCLGLGLPFLATGLVFERALGAFGVVKRHYRLVTLVGGGLLVLIGVAEVTGAWRSLIDQLQSDIPWSPNLPL